MQQMLDAYLDLLNLAFSEATCAFDGLADENVWKRPAEGLLSVGELAGHVAFWEATRFAGEGTDTSKCAVKSPLIDPRFRYYDPTLATSPSPDHLAMTAQQVKNELMRVHEEGVACLKAKNPELDAPVPGWESDENFPSLREALKYQVFHAAYHVGQMYSARHLLGEETPDN